ncbi:hypothetical protein [Gracilibacillus saliphilus]|uniref:hypothetical protein n=1 Tax=Gracilibacillus saliphilus TaxID=543890 RepID=UPI0013CFF9F8|nr:hypothetical protein [Gracilibacillus saliphilus]
MKNLFYICFSLLLILSACDLNSESQEQNSDSQVEQEQTKNDQEDNESKDRDLFGMGDFEILKEKTDIGTYKIGPISLVIKSIAVERGELNNISEILQERLPKGEIEVIEVLMTMTSERKDIEFTQDNFQLTTDAGEHFNKPEGLMSTALNSDFAYTDSETGSGDYYVTVSYILGQSKAEALEEVEFHVKAPTDSNGESLGEDIHTTIPILPVE